MNAERAASMALVSPTAMLTIIVLLIITICFQRLARVPRTGAMPLAHLRCFVAFLHHLGVATLARGLHLHENTRRGTRLYTSLVNATHGMSTLTPLTLLLQPYLPLPSLPVLFNKPYLLFLVFSSQPPHFGRPCTFPKKPSNSPRSFSRRPSPAISPPLPALVDTPTHSPSHSSSPHPPLASSQPSLFTYRPSSSTSTHTPPLHPHRLAYTLMRHRLRNSLRLPSRRPSSLLFRQLMRAQTPLRQ